MSRWFQICWDQDSKTISFLPAEGTSGGILVATLDDHFQLLSSSRPKYSLTVRIQALQDASKWTLTRVYGPQNEPDKIIFLEEIKVLWQAIQGEWLLCGDFNLIYKAKDKHNNRLNRRRMGLFKGVLDDLELRELPLHGRKFTWTNGQNEATMTRINCVFCSTSWEEQFPRSHLHARASTLPDHCPLILQGDTAVRKFKGFRFESYWLKLPGFQDVVKQAWGKPLLPTNPIRWLHIKLARTTKALKQWEKSNIGNIKMQLAIIGEVIWQLDQAQERRNLSQTEVAFRDRLKEIYLGLLALERVRTRQRSRMTNIKHDRANTKLFYLRANGRKRKKHI
jgi:hypothetical protein